MRGSSDARAILGALDQPRARRQFQDTVLSQNIGARDPGQSNPGLLGGMAEITLTDSNADSF